jgi:protein-disulfide isomerase/plastocyanin
MKDFIKRNMPVFVIGIITLVVFLGIIIASQKNQQADTPYLTETSNENLVTEHTYTLGNSNAPVTLVEFSDYQCPACKAYEPIVREISSKYSDKLRVAYRHFPLPQHPFAFDAAKAAQAAGEQGMFWQYSTVLFENNEKLTKDDLVKYAQQAGLDVAKFENDFNSERIRQMVTEDYQTATRLNLPGTPTFFLNGKLINVSSPVDLENQIVSELERHQINETSQPEDTTQIKDIKETNESTPSEETDAFNSSDNNTIRIEFTDKGFVPRTITAKQMQKVRFVNKTNEQIVFEQLNDKYLELNSEKALNAGEGFELTLTETESWEYKEKGSGYTGSVYVYPL